MDRRRLHSRRVGVALHHHPAAMGTALADDDHDDGEDHKTRNGNDQAGELDPVVTDCHGLRGVYSTQHGDKIVSDAHVIAQAGVGKETHHVMANRGVIGGVHTAEKAHRVVPHLAVEADISEKNDHIVIHFAFDANAAKEADRIPDRSIGRHVDVAEERNRVVIGVRSSRAGREGRDGYQKSGEDGQFPRH